MADGEPPHDGGGACQRSSVDEGQEGPQQLRVEQAHSFV
jgi:hypothetical protein